MIYETPEETSPLRQGDIFLSLPRLALSLKKIPVIDGDRFVEKTWADIAKSKPPTEAIISIGAIPAIVVSQDCDATRSAEISLCEIRRFTEVHPKARDTTSVNKWVSVITQHARSNPKWFYLPPDANLFPERMGVDFFSIFRLSRDDLEAYRNLRRARLIDIARNHFRERISEFFRRYPYDEWYPLSAAEFAQYREKQDPDAHPFAWQR